MKDEKKGFTRMEFFKYMLYIFTDYSPWC